MNPLVVRAVVEELENYPDLVCVGIEVSPTLRTPAGGWVVRSVRQFMGYPPLYSTKATETITFVMVHRFPLDKSQARWIEGCALDLVPPGCGVRFTWAQKV